MVFAIRRRPPPLNGTNFQTFFYPTFFFCNWILHIYETDFTLGLRQKYHTFPFWLFEPFPLGRDQKKWNYIVIICWTPAEGSTKNRQSWSWHITPVLRTQNPRDLGTVRSEFIKCLSNCCGASVTPTIIHIGCIPDICQFWNTTTLSRPVQSTPKRV